jgi:hypothetical protein
LIGKLIHLLCLCDLLLLLTHNQQPSAWRYVGNELASFAGADLSRFAIEDFAFE